MARTKLFQRGVDFECPLAVAAIDAGVEQRIAVVHARGLPRCSHLAPHPQSTLHLPCLPSIAASIPQQKRDDISAVLASLRLDRSGCWRPTAIIPQPAWLALQSLLLSNACQGLFAKRLWCATHSLYRGDNGWTPERTQLFLRAKGPCAKKTVLVDYKACCKLATRIFCLDPLHHAFHQTAQKHHTVDIHSTSAYNHTK